MVGATVGKHWNGKSDSAAETGVIVSGPINCRLEFDGARVLVIGDLMLDRYRYGAVSRISPEAPVPVMHVSDERAMLGGAGNVLSNIAALDCMSGLIAVVGDDEAGRQCRSMIESIGADPSLLVAVAGRPTTVKTRMISGSQQLLRCDEEDSSPFPGEVISALISRFDAAVGRFNIVAISDYAKGVLSDAFLAHVIGRCGALGIPLVVDPKRRDLRAYAGATVIKPNRRELADFVGQPCSDAESCRQAAQHAVEMTGATILVTLSEQGMALLQPGGEMRELHATATEVYDVSGAGDTALAILCAAMASGHDVHEAALLANAGAGEVVRKLGTATLSRLELDQAVKALESTALGSICTREEAARQVARWRDEGLRVGFTNGCFDIVHAGHVSLLRRARAICDRLVVGLNSDASVARLKGPSRPIQPEVSRAEVLAAIDAVDLVVVFEEDTPLALITALQPSDLIKGSDYTEDTVVGAKQVKAAGGRVHLLELVPGLSTSRAVERIKQGAEPDLENGERPAARHLAMSGIHSELRQ